MELVSPASPHICALEDEVTAFAATGPLLCGRFSGCLPFAFPFELRDFGFAGVQNRFLEEDDRSPSNFTSAMTSSSSSPSERAFAAASKEVDDRITLGVGLGDLPVFDRVVDVRGFDGPAIAFLCFTLYDDSPVYSGPLGIC